MHTKTKHLMNNPFLSKTVAPGTPVGPLEVSDIKADSVTLSWKQPKTDGGSKVTKYVIEKCDTKRKNWSPVGDVDSKTLSFIVPKLFEDTPYLFRVSAINAEGQGEPLTTETEVIPKKPAEKPGKLSGKVTFTRPTKDGVTLNWSAPKKDGGAPIKGYKIEVSNDGKTWRDLETVNKMNTDFNVRKLEPGQDYYFRVSAENDVGFGEASTSEVFKLEKKIGLYCTI